MKKFIVEMNDNHESWYLKSPPAFKMIENLYDSLRNPYFIFVGRDPVAVLNRSSIEGKMQAESSGVIDVLNYYLKVAKFLHLCERPVFWVSYEKAVGNPGEIVKGLAEFVGCTNNEHIEKAVLNLQPDNANYLSKK